MRETIGIIGSGQVAQVLARGFKGKGYDVRIGSREPEKLRGFAAESGVAAGTFAEVAAFGAVLVLAVKGSAARTVLDLCGDALLTGKLVIDATNPIADAPPDGAMLRFFTGPNDSLMERLQAAYPETRFVKAWNSVGHAFMVDPRLPGGPPTMFICGDDAGAKERVTAILGEFGWATEDVGGATSARALEALCQLWCAPGFLRNQWSHAFKLLKP